MEITLKLVGEKSQISKMRLEYKDSIMFFEVEDLLENMIEPGDFPATCTQIKKRTGVKQSPELIGKYLTMAGFSSKVMRIGSSPQKVYLIKWKK